MRPAVWLLMVGPAFRVTGGSLKSLGERGWRLEEVERSIFRSGVRLILAASKDLRLDGVGVGLSLYSWRLG